MQRLVDRMARFSTVGWDLADFSTFLTWLAQLHTKSPPPRKRRLLTRTLTDIHNSFDDLEPYTPSDDSSHSESEEEGADLQPPVATVSVVDLTDEPPPASADPASTDRPVYDPKVKSFSAFFDEALSTFYFLLV